MDQKKEYVIHKAELRFTEPLKPLKGVKKLIIHHTEETNWDIFTTHQFHQHEKKWDGIGYNYFIEGSGELDGFIYEARGLREGAHALGYNRDALGICLSGNFDLILPTEKQMQALIWLCKRLMKQFDLEVSDVLGHRETGAKKTCPGELFDMNVFRNQLMNT